MLIEAEEEEIQMHYPMETPYTIKRTTNRMFGSNTYSILFEDTPIRQITGNESFVEELIVLLNAAWKLGFMKGGMLAELDNEFSKQENTGNSITN